MILFRASGLRGKLNVFLTDWIGTETWSVLNRASECSHHLFLPHFLTLFPLSLQQAVKNDGRRHKDAVLINTNTGS